MVKSTDYSSKGPEFKFQQPYGGSQPSVMRSDALFWGCLKTATVYLHIIIIIIIIDTKVAKGILKKERKTCYKIT